MRNILKNIFKKDIRPKYIESKNLKNLSRNIDYQLVHVMPREEWTNNHILFSVLIVPGEFKKVYKNVLDKTKKIIILGEYHHMAQYYRFLEYHGYEVYLLN